MSLRLIILPIQPGVTSVFCIHQIESWYILQLSSSLYLFIYPLSLYLTILLCFMLNVYPTFMDHYMNKENISINNSKFYCQLNLRALKGLIDLNFFEDSWIMHHDLIQPTLIFCWLYMIDIASQIHYHQQPLKFTVTSRISEIKYWYLMRCSHDKGRDTNDCCILFPNNAKLGAPKNQFSSLPDFLARHKNKNWK